MCRAHESRDLGKALGQTTQITLEIKLITSLFNAQHERVGIRVNVVFGSGIRVASFPVFTGRSYSKRRLWVDSDCSRRTYLTYYICFF